MNSRHRRDELFGYVLGRPEGICLAPHFTFKTEMVDFGRGGWAVSMSV